MGIFKLFLLFLLCSNSYSNSQTEEFLRLLARNRDPRIKVIKVPPCPASILEISTMEINISPELKSWGSGAIPKVFTSNTLNLFFKELFIIIHKNFPDIDLSPLNLFHGHLIKTQNDFIVIFHAFEYPVDLEPQKFLAAKKFGMNLKPFLSSSPSYKKRNLIWSQRDQKIYRFDSTDQSFNFLIKSPAFDLYPIEVLRANSVQESIFGKRLFDINFLQNILFLTD